MPIWRSRALCRGITIGFPATEPVEVELGVEEPAADEGVDALANCIYVSKRLGPPQYSMVLPLQVMSH